jgi:hypothetical protein
MGVDELFGQTPRAFLWCAAKPWRIDRFEALLEYFDQKGKPLP